MNHAHPMQPNVAHHQADRMEHNMEHSNRQYGYLLIMGILSFISMYVLMYTMVDTFANVLANFNQFYMAGLMTAPMILIELLLMRAMYQNKKWNALIGGAASLL